MIIYPNVQGHGCGDLDDSQSQAVDVCTGCGGSAILDGWATTCEAKLKTEKVSKNLQNTLNSTKKCMKLIFCRSQILLWKDIAV